MPLEHNGTSEERLDGSNFRKLFSAYVQQLKDIRVPRLPRTPLHLFAALKRNAVRGGKYDGVSMFEFANRVMSDLVVWKAVDHLLFGQTSSGRGGCAVEIRARFGVANGFDLDGRLLDGRRLRGECFNVAPSFFGIKRRSSEAKLRKVRGGLRVVAFNRDALPESKKDGGFYAKRGWLYLDLDIKGLLRELEG